MDQRVPMIRLGRPALLLIVVLGVATASAARASQVPSKPPSHAVTPAQTGAPASPAAYGVVSRSAPACTTTAAAAPALAASATAMTTLQPSASRTGAAAAAPFGVAVTADGSWGFASLRDGRRSGVPARAAAAARQRSQWRRRPAPPAGLARGSRSLAPRCQTAISASLTAAQDCRKFAASLPPVRRPTLTL
jgi:hypothetical protein